MEEEGGITFGEICHLIGKRIWWTLGISVIVALVASLVFAFVINRGKNDYSLTFMVEFPGVEEREYPDGTTFNFASMVYAGQLEAAKASDEAFASIDVDAMSSNGHIVIKAETVESASGATELTGVYTITVSSAYFKNSAQASDFLRAVLSQTIATVNAKMAGIDFSAGLAGYTLYNSYTAYGDRLAALIKQQETLLERYAEITGNVRTDPDTTTQPQKSVSYGGFVYKAPDWSEGRSISALYAEAQALDSVLTQLKNEYDSFGYVLIGDEDNYETLAKNWAKQITENKNELQAYQTQFNGAVITEGDYVDKVLTLTSANKLLRGQITSVGYIYNDDDGSVSESPDAAAVRAENAEFGAAVQTAYENVLANSKVAKDAFVALFQAESQIVYQQSGVTVVNNTTNIILVVVAALVVAFLLASIIFCAVDYPAYKKLRDEKRRAAAAAADTQNEKTE